jgi:hypothetical protein
MKTISLFLILSLINLWVGCYSSEFIRPNAESDFSSMDENFEEERDAQTQYGHPGYAADLTELPSITVLTKDSFIYDFEEKQYRVTEAAVSGMASRVTLDTVIAGMHAYDTKIIRNRNDPEYVKIKFKDIEEIEYIEYSKFDAGTIVLITGLAVGTTLIIQMLKETGKDIEEGIGKVAEETIRDIRF